MSLLDRLLGDDEPDEQVDLHGRREEADEALQRQVDAEAHGIEDCAVTGVAVVNEGPDEEPIVVPIARFSLGEDVESPERDLVWELAAAAVPVLSDAFDGVFVRHYDVQFTFDGDGLFEAETCRRIAATPEVAERVATETGFGVADFRTLMLDEHDIDDDVAPVAWGECKNYSDRQNGAVVAASVAGSASAASCAGAASAGGGGGAC
jgi:hypothetical protein